MKKGKEDIRTPRDLQKRGSDVSGTRKTNIGLALRQAKRSLWIRRMIYILIFLILAAVILGFIFTGFFDQWIHNLVEELS